MFFTSYESKEGEKSHEAMCTLLQISTLLRQAEESASRAVANVNFKRQELAYVDYMISSEILWNIIPHHQAFASLAENKGKHDLYSDLCKVSLFTSETSPTLVESY